MLQIEFFSLFWEDGTFYFLVWNMNQIEKVLRMNGRDMYAIVKMYRFWLYFLTLFFLLKTTIFGWIFVPAPRASTRWSAGRQRWPWPTWTGRWSSRSRMSCRWWWGKANQMSVSMALYHSRPIRSECHNRLDNPVEALEDATRAMELNPENTRWEKYCQILGS